MSVIGWGVNNAHWYMHYIMKVVYTHIPYASTLGVVFIASDINLLLLHMPERCIQRCAYYILTGVCVHLYGAGIVTRVIIYCYWVRDFLQ